MTLGNEFFLLVVNIITIIMAIVAMVLYGETRDDRASNSLDALVYLGLTFTILFNIGAICVIIDAVTK